MSSFLVDKKDVKNFVNKPTMLNQQGIYFAYSAPPEVIQKLLPPPLEYVAPVVMGYLAHFGSTTFGGPYMELMLVNPCSYKGMMGGYAYNLMVSGFGAEMAVIVGSNCCGIPKKMADNMSINRTGNEITAKVEGHGATIFECKVDLDGEYNLPIAAEFFGDPQIGEVKHGGAFFHTFTPCQTDQGNTVFTNLNLVKSNIDVKTSVWEPGKLVEIKMNSTPDDPFGELEVLNPLGAAYYENESLVMANTEILENLDPDVVMPYLMTGRYDRCMMGEPSTYFIPYKCDRV